MDHTERDAFLQSTEPAYVGCVATAGEADWPHAVPVWYRWDGRAIHVWTTASLRWARNVRRDPRVSFTVFEHAHPLRAVYIKGKAAVRTGSMAELLDHIRPIVARYSADPDATIAAYDDGSEQVAVTIEPTSIAARANASSAEKPARTLPLTADELLSTTRAVRRRLDLSRPVEREVLEECLALAVQAPTASYRQDWHFVVVTDAERRHRLGELYRRGAEPYFEGIDLASTPLLASAKYLVDHLDEVPVLLVPCVEGRLDGLPANQQASRWASIIPATWSFMLAARVRGLGTCWTTFHLSYEHEAAELLGIPYDDVTQAALVPVAYTKGTNFRPAPRLPLADVVHWDGW